MSQGKTILYNIEARAALKRGIDALANAVKTTLGPKGRNVAIDRGNGNPLITKDGVTVAREIILRDPLENLGAQMVKEVSSRTNDKAGDGTTTATVLAQAIVTEGLKNVTAGANPMDLKRGIDISVREVIAELKKHSRKVNDQNEIYQVATISSNNDEEIGKFIADAFDKAGKDGVITVDKARGVETTIDMKEGMQFDRGYISPYFVTNPETMEAILDNPLIILYDGKISSLKDIVPSLEYVTQQGRSILIIADDVEGEALSALVVNKLRGGLRVIAIKSPGYGDKKTAMMEDIAVLTGATYISPNVGQRLDQATQHNYFGQALKVTVEKDRTVFIVNQDDDNKDLISQRVTQIRAQIENSKSEYDTEKLKERLARLTSGIAVINIGAASELELEEKKTRVEDALNATRAAIEEGINLGGGVSYIRARSVLKTKAFQDKLKNLDMKTGADIIYRALEEPLRQIAANTGYEASVVVNTVELNSLREFGFNAASEKFGNLYDEGVIDPFKVTRIALENAASIAGLFLTTEAVIVDSNDSQNNGMQMAKFQQQGMPY